MIFTKGKVTVCSMVLAATMWHGSYARNEDSWMGTVRRLDVAQFMPICEDVFMTPDHMQQHSYLMSAFAEEVTDLCIKIAPNPDQGSCRRTSFGSLHPSLRDAFFRQADIHAGNRPFPMETVMSWGDAGYVISDKSTIQQNAMRNDLCAEVFASIGGDDFIDQIPSSSKPIVKKPATKEIPTKSEDILSSQASKGTDLVGNNDQPFTIIQGSKGDNLVSIGTIIAVSCAVAAIIVLFFYFEAIRRKRARLSRSKSGDGVISVTTYSGGRNTQRVKTPVEELKVAINDADWDKVYRYASQIAENDDGLSYPEEDSFKFQYRGHLNAEDQERSKTLDELAACGDWTGVAVTAALYSGETSGSAYHNEESTITFGAEHTVESEDIEEGHLSMEEMVTGVSEALNSGDWSAVSKYANLIKDQKQSVSSFDDSQAIFSESFMSSASSLSSTDTEASKKQTIEKLIKAGKWKGVSIMANMYEMESKQSSPPTSPSHPYGGRRRDP